MRCFIGIDAGGTNTRGLCVSEDGKVIAHAIGGTGNYQVVGINQAFSTIKDVVEVCLHQASINNYEVASIGFGISGLDRKKDEDIITKMIGDMQISSPYVLKNDTFLILRAGTDDGVGIAVVSGTGSNTVGRARDGKEMRVGGLGFEFGDTGSGHDIAVAGIRAAFRARDGRGPNTIIGRLIVDRLSLKDLDDLVDLGIPSEGTENNEIKYSISMLAPLVFEAADMGDQVAKSILVEMGRDLGLSVVLVGKRLFSREDTFPLVLGGSVLSKTKISLFADTIIEYTKSYFPNVQGFVLSYPPVVGGVLLAIDEYVRNHPDCGCDDLPQCKSFKQQIIEQSRMFF